MKTTILDRNHHKYFFYDGRAYCYADKNRLMRFCYPCPSCGEYSGLWSDPAELSSLKYKCEKCKGLSACIKWFEGGGKWIEVSEFPVAPKQRVHLVEQG